jgi:formylglycine-generating enzyme required for sulfatase activity
MDIPYAMARNEITHAQWMACVEDGGCTHVPDHRVLTLDGPQALGMGPNHPVINVSYLDVQHYVDWLNRKAGAKVYRLPTEAEWEYAARAGTETPFAQGAELTAEQANFSRLGTERSLGKPQPQLIDRETPVEVVELGAANGWGLRHMSGNVDEITLSCWTPTHIGLTSDSAYLAHTLAQGSCQRVAKGGSFNRGMDWCRLAVRTHPPETARTYYRGFRVVQELWSAR